MLSIAHSHASLDYHTACEGTAMEGMIHHVPPALYAHESLS